MSRVKGLLHLEKDEIRKDLGKQIGEYTDLFDEASADQRKSHYSTVVNKYYDLATDFYEFGWGTSFHFAPRHKWESLDASIERHELWLAHRLGLKPNMKVMDIGCGVGGPLRNIAKFSGSRIVGLNNNEYQVTRAKRIAADCRLGPLATFVKGDFMHIPTENGSFDAAYAIEATCHAPDRVGVYSEIFRILKPGGRLGLYEWVMTNKYDANNPEQVALKKGIERGNGLPDLEHINTILEALKEAGFEVIENFDIAPTSDVPWYLPLVGRITATGLVHTRIGRWVSLNGLWVLEKIKIAPAGSAATLDMLQRGADALCESGRREIFTPMWWVLAQKPE